MKTDDVINLIVDRVLAKLQEREHQALVVFTGGAIGFHESMEQLKKLQKNGWKLKVVLSSSAEHIVTKELIQKELSIKTVYVESENKGIQFLSQDSSILLIPTLTMNTAAKVALGISDSLATNIISKFLMEGLPIIAAEDACTPEHPFRLKAGRKMPSSSYINMYDEYLTRLEDFGIKLVGAEHIQKSVIHYQQTRFYEKQVKSTTNQTVINTDKKQVITRQDVMRARENGGVLTIHSNTIVTPLAIETANSAGVKIVRSGE
ncbi:flavoprotein [Oceanobacillus halophilus]|uniref:Flavoprotein n=1 Tax=Oceanobacillus halophilus TaxID=930130 RepID=A0A494ZTZ5_9BACI|nr:flavoprotein [Oceanobacillus halophilus]RKQ29249.1 flavoprotein [Oceanobacillus halophilus]